MIAMTDISNLSVDELDKIKDEITKLHFSKPIIGLMAICNKCGGRSISTCKCAKERYKKSITNDTIQKYLENNESFKVNK